MTSPRPEVGPYTEQAYSELPDVYRSADETQGYPLLSWLSLLLDQLTAVHTLLGRFQYTPPDEREGTEDVGLGLPPRWRRYNEGTYNEGTYGDKNTSELVAPLYADVAWLPWLTQVLGVDVTGITSVAAQRTALATPERTWARGSNRWITNTLRDVPGVLRVSAFPHHQGDPFTIRIEARVTNVATSTLPAQAGRVRPAGYALAFELH